MAYRRAHNIACIGDSQTCSEKYIPQSRSTSREYGSRGQAANVTTSIHVLDRESRKFESRIRQPEAELERHGLIVIVKMTIIDQESFSEVRLPSVRVICVDKRCRILDLGKGVGILGQGDRVWQFPAARGQPNAKIFVQ